MRLVPWSSWAEWAAVGGALLAGCADGCGAAGADAACAAASRVATWRVRGRLPLAVEVTAALAEARAQDAAFTGRPGTPPPHGTRMMREAAAPIRYTFLT
jgi:ribosomal biogenesis protein LAS1